MSLILKLFASDIIFANHSQDGLKGRAASYSGSIESDFPDVWMFAGPRGESVLAGRWRRKQEKRDDNETGI